MFRDKPSAYDRVSDAVGDLGSRIADLESQFAERVNPRPSRLERVRRSIESELARLPGVTSPYRPSSYLPSALTNWSLPTYSDAQTQVSRAQRSLRDGAHDVGERLPSWSSMSSWSSVPSWSSVRWPSFGGTHRASYRTGRDVQRGVDFFRERPNLTTALIVGGAVVAAGAAFYVTKKIAEHSEEPDYDVVRDEGDIEIRDYDSMVVAETIKSGYHEKARRRGFETLYDYLRANNRNGKKIAMTVPVLQQLSEGGGRTKGWAIRLVMPKKYTTATLPKPGTDDVAITEVAARRLVAIRFDGVFNASLASKKLMTLYNYVSDQNLKQKGDPIYAFYNPPWTPGFMRRNEILLEVDR